MCEWEALERRWGQTTPVLRLSPRDIHIWRIDLPGSVQARAYVHPRRLEILAAYAGDAGDLHASTSYTDGIALFAVARRAIGVDVELQREVTGADAIARSYFAGTEYARWRREQSPSTQFLCYWTRKEAYLKALGLGFEHPPQNVDASCDTRAGAIFNATDAFESLRWTVFSFQPCCGYTAALAHAREPGICFRWLRAVSP
jgi:hypothetical protein